MKKIGIIGGLGPESTLDYYRGIIDAFKPTFDKVGYPEIIIESVNLKQALFWAENNEWDKVVDLIGGRCEAMHLAGAEFGAIASNTPHRVFDLIQENTALPLLSIVTATKEYARQHGLKKLLLLGTKFTMQSDFYPKEFMPFDIELIVPNEDEQNYIQEKLFSEIELGIIKVDTKLELLRIINRYMSQHIDGVIMGCTEFPLILKADDIDTVYLDTVQIHIQSIVQCCTQPEEF